MDYGKSTQGVNYILEGGKELNKNWEVKVLRKKCEKQGKKSCPF